MDTAAKSVTPMVADAVFDPSATLIAVMVITPAEAGAVKVTDLPEALVVAEKEPPPFEDHVTPWLPVSLVSVALKEFVCVTVRPARFGETLTVIFEPAGEDVVAKSVLE